MSQRNTYEVNLKSDGRIMTHHSNGADDGGPPTLFGNFAPADTPGQSISILSAVTGKEVPRTAARKKKLPVMPSVLFLLLLVTGVLGFNFWQQNENALAPTLVTTQHKPTIAAPAKLVPVQTSPIPDGSIASTNTTNTSDVAVVETVKPAPTLASTTTPSQPERKIKLVSTKPANKTASASKAQTKRATTTADATRKRNRAQQKTAQINKTSNTVKTVSARGSDAKEAPSKPKKVSVAKAGGDPDEKLLEGMLRLMKRENAKDATNMSSTK